MGIVRLLSIVLLACALGACSAEAPAAPTLGAPAPSLVLPARSGETVDLASLRGNVVLVNFWASWCEPCTREMPRFQQWHEQFERDGLTILGVNTLYQDQLPNVEAFLDARSISYPILMDEQGTTSRQWLVRNLPYSYVIDRRGDVTFLKLGEFTEQDFEQQVLPLVDQ